MTFTFNANISAPPNSAPVAQQADLGLLEGFLGRWEGTGFNTIWRPVHGQAQEHFLELNHTTETLEFEEINGPIPNRGLLQADLFMGGVRYLQQVADSNIAKTDPNNSGIHIEPGLWLSVPKSDDPSVPLSVARLASIPHGVTLVAQGNGLNLANTAPIFAPVDLNPFPFGNRAGATRFPEQDLSTPSAFRTPDADLDGITQAMVDNPNSLLATELAGRVPTSMQVLIISTAQTPILGGGTANTAFLEGDPSDGPNADAAQVTATFWIEKFADGTELLQYTQTVLLNFNGLSWPHVSVATLGRPAVAQGQA